MASDISYGSIMIFDNQGTGDWKRRSQEKIKYGMFKLSDNTGAIFSGISAETLYISNNLDVSNALYVRNNATINNDLHIKGNAICNNIPAAVNYQQFVDVSTNLIEQKNQHLSDISENILIYNNLKQRLNSAIIRTTELMEKAIPKNAYSQV
tara:strand:+ start:2624 stop:3079 length:456 start_codon:yes stop_codon:yes gene_type:complete